jgi:hypothetical protein
MDIADIGQDLLEIYLPDIDWTRYQLEQIGRIEDTNILPFTWRLNFFVVEKNIIPDEYSNLAVVSKWFYEVQKMKDFQARTKIVTVHMKRRKWYSSTQKKSISQDIDFGYKQQSTEEMIFFFTNSLNKEK